MTLKTHGYFTRGFSKAAAVALAMTIASPAAAEPAGDPARIDLLRPDKLLVQITDQDSAETTGDRYRLSAAYTSGQFRGYKDVSRANLLNSPAARYFARKLTGSGGN